MMRALVALLLLAGCVSFPPPPPARVAPQLVGDALVARDGARLGLSSWPAADPKAIVLAVHGMNDYGGHFRDFGAWLAKNAGVTVYAYDQRGFGRSPGFGRWPGGGALVGDLGAAIAAIRARHGRTPIYVLGHSMGAAILMAAARKAPLDAAGAILVAPGVWGRSRMPLLYRASLNAGAALFPEKTLTGERAGRQSTDNIPVLREMMADPYVIKDTRLDSILGVVRAMGRGWDASDEIGGRILFLMGEKDEIIPFKAMEKAAERLCGEVEVRRYAEGWHLLLRDLQAERVWRDIADWLDGANAAGPGFGPAAVTCVAAEKAADDGTQQRAGPAP